MFDFLVTILTFGKFNKKSGNVLKQGGWIFAERLKDAGQNRLTKKYGTVADLELRAVGFNHRHFAVVEIDDLTVLAPQGLPVTLQIFSVKHLGFLLGGFFVSGHIGDY